MATSRNNPLKELRLAIKPTTSHIARRSWRDKDKSFLLQRELADLIGCSVTTVRMAEKDRRLPLQKGIRRNAEKLYVRHLGAENMPQM